jgi:hypothetical protein
LHEIVGVVERAAHSVAVRAELPSMRLDKLGEGFLIAISRCLDEGIHGAKA